MNLEIERLKHSASDYVNQLAKLTEQLEESNLRFEKVSLQNEESKAMEKAYSQLKAMYEQSQQQRTGSFAKSSDVLILIASYEILSAELETLVSDKGEQIKKKSLEAAQYLQLIK